MSVGGDNIKGINDNFNEGSSPTGEGNPADLPAYEADWEAPGGAEPSASSSEALTPIALALSLPIEAGPDSSAPPPLPAEPPLVPSLSTCAGRDSPLSLPLLPADTAPPATVLGSELADTMASQPLPGPLPDAVRLPASGRAVPAELPGARESLACEHTEGECGHAPAPPTPLPPPPMLGTAPAAPVGGNALNGMTEVAASPGPYAAETEAATTAATAAVETPAKAGKGGPSGHADIKADDEGGRVTGDVCSGRCGDRGGGTMEEKATEAERGDEGEEGSGAGDDDAEREQGGQGEGEGEARAEDVETGEEEEWEEEAQAAGLENGADEEEGEEEEGDETEEDEEGEEEMEDEGAEEEGEGDEEDEEADEEGADGGTEGDDDGSDGNEGVQDEGAQEHEQQRQEDGATAEGEGDEEADEEGEGDESEEREEEAADESKAGQEEADEEESEETDGEKARPQAVDAKQEGEGAGRTKSRETRQATGHGKDDADSKEDGSAERVVEAAEVTGRKGAAAAEAARAGVVVGDPDRSTGDVDAAAVAALGDGDARSDIGLVSNRLPHADTTAPVCGNDRQERAGTADRVAKTETTGDEATRSGAGAGSNSVTGISRGGPTKCGLRIATAECAHDKSDGGGVGVGVIHDGVDHVLPPTPVASVQLLSDAFPSARSFAPLQPLPPGTSAPFMDTSTDSRSQLAGAVEDTPAAITTGTVDPGGQLPSMPPPVCAMPCHTT